MDGMWMMFQRGMGVGFWVVGLALVLIVALPVFGLLLALIARMIRSGNRDGGDV
mgnify:CR=1 FL=1